MRWVLFSIAAVVIFTVFTTVYALSAPANSVRALPKWLWVLLCLFVPVFGGLLYVTVGRPVGGSGPSTAPTRNVAPDEDPDFLRKLDEQIRKRREESGE